MSIVVNSNEENRAIYKKDDERIYLWLSIDPLRERVRFFLITEKEYHGTLEGIVVSDQKVFGGRFECNEEKFIAVSEEDYDADFWGVENDGGFSLEFDRVE